MEKISQLNSKLRELLRDTLIENCRKNNFIRIYPCKSCEFYDQYFAQ